MSLFVDIIRITYLITENKFKIQRKNIYINTNIPVSRKNPSVIQ